MTPRDHIDLNSDLGESALPAHVDRDLALLQIISSANIACGGHAGDEATMRQMIAAARDANVAIGAHPSYPDRENFGRVSFKISAMDLQHALRDQLEALLGVVAVLDASAAHVKPHGALYHDASQNAAVAEAVLSAIVDVGGFCAVIGPPGAVLLELAPRYYLTPIVEAFADRRYEPDGRLRSRSVPGALIDDPHAAAAQALALVRHAQVRCIDDTATAVFAETICIHSDTDNSPAIARSVRDLLEASGIALAACRVWRA
ncbi:MAG: 5-oxoprolinase subunit PxpA [Phycisphaerales bacterium]|nr:5-oxoprolinase subunit PxpA [Phycisphaerales bacterium]